jgi:hypothetical protein
MKTIKNILLTAVAFLGLTVASNAISLNGLYIEAGTSAVGVELDGNHNASDGSVTVGQIGKTAVTGQYGIGWMIGTGKLGLDVGYSVTPGEASMKTSSDHTNSSGAVTFEVSDATEYYVSPMINFTDDAALYLKFGWNDADTKATGDVTKPSGLSGETLALGTVMKMGERLYIRSEAGMTDYDKISVTGLGTSCGQDNSGCVSTDTKVTASPTIHYGRVSIGLKF